MAHVFLVLWQFSMSVVQSKSKKLYDENESFIKKKKYFVNVLSIANILPRRHTIMTLQSYYFSKIIKEMSRLEMFRKKNFIKTV